MSYHIEYQAAAFVLPASELGLPEPRFAVVIEGGSSNLTAKDRFGQERLVREWEIGMLGTATQVLRQAVGRGSSCEGGCLKLAGRRATPETYIRRARKLLANASYDFRRHVTLSATVLETHALVPLAAAAGFTVYPAPRYGEALVKLIPSSQDEQGWASYFRVMDSTLDGFDIPPFRLGEVYGMPAS